MSSSESESSEFEYDSDDEKDVEISQPEVKEHHGQSTTTCSLDTEFTEQFDQHRLAYIIANTKRFKKLMSRVTHPDWDPFVIAAKFLAKSRNGKITVQYHQTRPNKGRWFANGSLSLQTLVKEIRHSIAGDLYHDIDMVNAHPVILEHLCSQHKIKCKRLTEYISDRDTHITAIAEKNKVSTGYVKVIILSLMNGGHCDYEKLKKPTRWLRALKREIEGILAKLCDIHQDEFTNHKEKLLAREKDHNHEGSFVNTLMCDIENEMLQTMIQVLNQHNCIKGMHAVLCFDGIMVPKTHAPENMNPILTQCEDAILAEHGIAMKIKIKPMEMGFTLPTNIPKYEDTKLDFYTDHDKLVRNGDVYLSAVDEWANNALVLIKGEGEQYILTKNKRVDPKTKLESISYKAVQYDKVMNALKVKIQVINEAYDPKVAALVKRKRRAKKEVTPLEALKAKRYLYTSLGNPTTHGSESYLKTRIEERNIRRANTFEFYPFLARNEVPKLYDSFNIFTGFPMERLPPNDLKFDESKLYAHIRDELCNGDVGEFKHFLDHIADMIQCPNEIRGTCHLFYSKQGMGKGLMANWISRVIGSDHVMTFVSMEDYTARFNYDQSNKLLKIFEELKDKGTAFHQHDRLKADLTKATIRIEVKCGAITHLKNYSRYWFYTNNENSLYIEADCRRYTLHRANNRHANDTRYFAPIWEEIKHPEFIKACFEYFAERKYDITNVLNPYDTQYKREQKLQNLNNGLKYIMHLVESDFNGVSRSGDFVTASSLWNGYQDWCSETGLRANTQQAFKQQILKVGIEKPKQQRFLQSRVVCFTLNANDLIQQFRALLKWPTFEFNADQV